MDVWPDPGDWGGGVSKNWVAVFAALLLCLGASDAAPLDAYGRLPTLSDITLSPDGTRIAYVKSDPSKRVVVILGIGTRQLLAVLDVGEEKLRALQWADDRRLLITMSTTTLPDGFIGHRQEFFLTLWFDVETKSFHRLFELLPENTLNAIAAVPQPRTIDGHAVVFVAGFYFPKTVTQIALYRVDLTTGVSRMIESGSDAHADESHADSWVVDAAGNIVAEADYYEVQQHWKLK